MRKKDLTVPAVFAEAVGIILGVVYIVLQLYYGLTYHVAVYSYACNIAALILVYAGLSVLSCYPERINRMTEKQCTGKIRRYSIRMVRVIKLVFVIGLMIPCVGDVLGTELKEAYSLLIIGVILLTAVYYECRIIRLLRKK
ncbi:MAG: transglycosylase [Lachnospiraceae bacterium]|nr:transglycosylase [Lachnospiraceae bacterium]